MGFASGVRALAALVAAAGAFATATAPAQAFEPRVPDSYFGVADPGLSVLARDGDPRLATHAAAIRTAGLGYVRSTVDWRQVEPVLGADGAHVYDWRATDRLVRGLAQQDLELVPSITGTPYWARALGALNCTGVAAISELHAGSFGALAGALVRRYGRGGSFWAQNPALAPQPIGRVEIWNEPNWTGSWCPGPQPERFAVSAAAAARAIDAVDPGVETILGGLVVIKEDAFYADGRIQGMATGTFLNRMVAAEPGLPELLDQVAVHLYHPDPARNVSLLAWFRDRMRDAGLGGAEIMITEFGWHTSGSSLALTEEARVKAFADFVSLVSRTDCGVTGLAVHAWQTAEVDPANPEDWFGIADPVTGALRPAGASYRDAVALFEGRGPAPAPRETMRVCGDPLPDQDGDGTPDESDDYPLDAARSGGSGEQPQAGPSVQPPPTPAIATAPAAWSKSSAPTFSYSSAGAAYYECRLDGGIWEPCGTTRQLSGLADGAHTFSVRALDAIDLRSPAARHDWNVDTRPPETTIVGGPSGLGTGDVTFELASDEPEPRFICRLDRSAWKWCGASASFPGLAEGAHVFEAVAVDRADNGDPTYATSSFEVRLVPAVPALEASGLETATPSFRFSAQRAASFECRFDGAAFQACSGVGEHTPAAPLSQGPHTFEVRGVSASGTPGPAAARSFTTPDTRSPETTIVSGPPSTVASAAVEFRLSSDEPGSTFRCRLDGAAWTACDAVAPFTGLADGRHVFEAVAADASGNADPTPARREFRVDRSPPELTLQPPASNRDLTPTLRFTATDVSGPVRTECRVDGAAWRECTSPWTTSKLKVGYHTLYVRATDAVGNSIVKSYTARFTARRLSRR